jgi:hypothetical protein
LVIKNLNDEEIEQIRQLDRSKLEEEYEDTLQNIKKRFNCEIAQSEAMDRSFLISSNIEDFLINHPYILFRPECYRLAFQAQELINELYQCLGRSVFNQE